MHRKRSLLLVVMSITWIGCQAAEDPAVVQQRQKYLLDQEPRGGLGVIDAHAQVSQQGTAEQTLVLVGRVGAGQDRTWDPGKAAFVVTDASAEISIHDHGAGHDHDSCPFCNADPKAANDSIALIKVMDEAGQVVPIDARKLLSIVEGQVVVVRGRASIDSLGNLVLVADGVYPRR